MSNRWVGAFVGISLMGMAGTAQATLLNFEIAYSGIATGSFVYDDVLKVVTIFESDFGEFGSFEETGFAGGVVTDPPVTGGILLGNFGFDLSGGTTPLLTKLDATLFGTGAYQVRGRDIGDNLVIVQTGTYSWEAIPVPEPSTLPVFVVGLAALALVTRRRRTGVGKTRRAS